MKLCFYPAALKSGPAKTGPAGPLPTPLRHPMACGQHSLGFKMVSKFLHLKTQNKTYNKQKPKMD